MSTLERILVIVDKKMRRTAALDRGAALARKSRAQLHLCLFDHDPMIDRAATLASPEIKRLAKTQYIETRQTWLSAQAVALADHGLRVECEVVWSPVIEDAVLDRILSISPDLVIKDVQHEPLRQRLVHAPVDLRMLRHSPVPVMMVRSNGKHLPRNIAAAIDIADTGAHGSSLNQTVLDSALKLGRYCSAIVHVVRVEVPFIAPSRESEPLYEAYVRVQQADRETFTAFCKEQGIPDACRHLLEGDATTELSRFAQRKDIDLLVVGSAFRSTVDRFMLGSTSEGVLNEVESEVLLVKPADFQSQLARHVDLAALHERQMAADA